MFNFKKGISPVVAVSLLIVVTVVAVVGFQNWYTNYQSQLTSDVSQKSSGQARVNIEFISNDGTLYVTNTGTSNLSITSINIGGVDCSINQNLTPGVNNFSISSCINTNLTKNDIVIVTPTGITKKNVFVGNVEIVVIPEIISYWNVTSNPSVNTDVANSIAIGIDGIYVAGYDLSLGNYQWRIEKRGFDGSSIWNVTSNPSVNTDVAYSIAIGTDGIYVGGSQNSLGNDMWRIEKRGFDGSSIWNVTSNPSVNWERVNNLKVGIDGIYIGGNNQISGNSQWRIEKRGFDGSSIWNITPNILGNNNNINSIAIGIDGIYIGGFDSAPGNAQWRIEKRGFNGASIWNVTSNPSVNLDAVNSIAVDSDSLYIAGYVSITPGDVQWRVEKRGFDGSSIWNVTSNPSVSSDTANSIVVGNDGIYVSGYDYSLGNSQWRIEKRSFDGSSIWNVTSNPSGNNDFATSMAISNSIYIAGYDNVLGNDRWRIEKRSLITGYQD